MSEPATPDYSDLTDLTPDSLNPSPAKVQNVFEETDRGQDEAGVETIASGFMSSMSVSLTSNPHADVFPAADLQPRGFEFVHLLGKGSYGMVCLARRILPLAAGQEEHVAIKRCRNIFRNTTDAKRHLRELRVLRKVHGTSLHVDILDAFSAGDCLAGGRGKFNSIYLVMERMPTDISNILKSNQYLSEDHIRWIGYQLLNAVNVLHSSGIVHRDIKPANVLIDCATNVKLCDFGLARYLEPNSSLPNKHANENSNCPNTPHVVTRWYRAPEIILMEPNYDHAVDMWSIGCMMAELFGMQSGNCRDVRLRQALFPGSSCFPLSPAIRGVPSIDRGDQLNIIVSNIGKPTQAQVEAFTSKAARLHLQRFMGDHNKQHLTLEQRYPQTSQEGINILRELLNWSPTHRIKASAAMAHDYFAQAREMAQEHARIALSQGHKPKSPHAGKHRAFAPFIDTDTTDIDELRGLIRDELDFFSAHRKSGRRSSIGHRSPDVKQDGVSKDTPDASTVKQALFPPKVALAREM